jgi:hypothetical protein
MRIRVVGRKSGVTDKDVGAAVSVAVGAIKAGRHKGVIKGKCLWVYNPYLDIATIKLLLSDSPSLVVKLDIDEYKYTDIESVLAAAAKLYKDDTVSQFTSSAMYKNIKAISDARYLEYIDKDAIANIFMATCEAASAEATIPQASSFHSEVFYLFNDGSDPPNQWASPNEYYDDLFSMGGINMDLTGLRTSLTRFAWFANSAITNTDATVIQDVYDSMTRSLAEAAFEDWTNTYKAVIDRVLAAIGNIKNNVPAYFSTLQTQYDEVPTTNIGDYASELRAAIDALPPDIDIGVSEELLYRMFGVIAIATTVGVCAQYVNRGIKTYNRIHELGVGAKGTAEKSMYPTLAYFWLDCVEGAIDFAVAFGKTCPDKAVKTVTDVSTVYADGGSMLRVHTMPAVAYMFRYATVALRTFTGKDDTMYYLFDAVGTSDVYVDCSVPCALLVSTAGVHVSEELQVNSHTKVVTNLRNTSIDRLNDLRSRNIIPDDYVVSQIDRSYVASGRGTCSSDTRIECNGIYAQGAGFPVRTDIQWESSSNRGDEYYWYDRQYWWLYYSRNIVYEHPVYKELDNLTSAVSIIPTYSVYPLLAGSARIAESTPITATGEYSRTSDFRGDYRVPRRSITNTSALSIDITANSSQVLGYEFESVRSDSITDMSSPPVRMWNDTAHVTINKEAVAEGLQADILSLDSISKLVLDIEDQSDDKFRYDLINCCAFGPVPDTCMPWCPNTEYAIDSVQVFNTDYGARHALCVDAQSMHHEVSYTASTDISAPEGEDGTIRNDDSTRYKTILNPEPMFVDGDAGPVVSTVSGRVVIIDYTGGVIYSADIVDVLVAAIYAGYVMRDVAYTNLFISDQEQNTGTTTVPIPTPPDIQPLGELRVYLDPDTLPCGNGRPCGTYTKTVTPSTYTVDNAPAPIRDYNKLLRCPEFLVLNSLMGDEYTDTSVTPSVTKHVPSFVPLDKAIQYMSMDGEGTPTPKLNVDQIQPIFVSDQSMIDQVKDRVNAHIAAKLQELSNTYLQDNPTAVVDEAVRKQLTPAAVKSAIEEQLFTPIRGILPAHTEVTTAAVKPVGASASSNAEPMGIEYVLSVVSRGIGTYVDLGVLA